MTDKIDDGGPAFPTDDAQIVLKKELAEKFGSEIEGILVLAAKRLGLSKRERFAETAMRFLLRNIASGHLPFQEVKWNAHDLARTSFDIADAMLAEEKKK